ncbi:MAG: putative toxin-antitoxin system toxin component, PIN family [Chloroflexota bacterium]
MRVVLDTNILISAVIRPKGRVGGVLQHLRDGTYTILYDDRTLNELVDVLNRPRIRDKYELSEQDIQTVLSLILLRGDAVECRESINDCRDPKDNKFLEVAVAGQADAVVSGDDDLQSLHPFRSISILTPADFLTLFNE